MITVTSSPHFHSGDSTQKIMFSVAAAMMPSCVFGICLFGFRAFLVLFASVASAVLTEYLLNRISKEKNTVWDGSAVVTGLLVGMNMTPSIPILIPVFASFLAIAVAKWTFGGLGANWANPAIVGRVFVFFSFTSAMSSFPMPSVLKAVAEVDAFSTPSPMSLVKTSLATGEFSGLSSLEILAAQKFPISPLALKLSQVTGFNPYNIDAFVGFMPGCIGEVSKFLIILGGLYLIFKKIITWHIPVSFLGSYAIFTWIFAGIPYGLGFFSGEVLPSILRGGLLLGAFFMATDYVTAPITENGKLIYGVGCGLITFLFRFFGSLPESTSVAILMMNIVTPTIDKFCKPRLFGTVRGKKK